MQIPGLPAIFFLIYLLILLPGLAFRSHQLFLSATYGRVAFPPRRTIWINTLFSQVVMLTLAWLVAWTIGFPLIRLPHLGAREAIAGGVALAVYFAFRSVAAAIRSENERRRLLVYAIAPRTAVEWLLWTATVLVAAVAGVEKVVNDLEVLDRSARSPLASPLRAEASRRGTESPRG